MFYLNCDEDFFLPDDSPPVSLRGEAGSSSSHPTSNGHLFQTNMTCKRSSSPIQVQSNRGRQPSVSESPTCGSWQVISQTGSLLSTDVHGTGSHFPSRLGSCEEASETIETERWERLDSVKRIFDNAYHHKITTKFKPDTGFTNVLDQFAEKFGFRQKGYF